MVGIAIRGLSLGVIVVGGLGKQSTDNKYSINMLTTKAERLVVELTWCLYLPLCLAGAIFTVAGVWVIFKRLNIYFFHVGYISGSGS